MIFDVSEAAFIAAGGTILQSKHYDWDQSRGKIGNLYLRWDWRAIDIADADEKGLDYYLKQWIEVDIPVTASEWESLFPRLRQKLAEFWFEACGGIVKVGEERQGWTAGIFGRKHIEFRAEGESLVILYNTERLVYPLLKSSWTAFGRKDG